VEVSRRAWHELKIECRGNKITGWLDGQVVIPEAMDTSFKSGKVGFWTKSDSVAYFTDAKIAFTPRELPAQVLVRNTLAKYPRLVGLRIYLLDESGQPHVVASQEAKEIGEAGGDAEKTAISAGKLFYGKGQDTVSVLQPLRDRNGEPIAAVRVTMKSFLGQTEQSALQRALPIVKSMQARVASLDDLKL
jgi:hypothetical protein